MSFSLNIGQILQYSFNLFGSMLPLVYLFAGASFAIFVFAMIIQKVKGDK